MQNQVKPDSLSSEISSVGGAVPTSPPDENAKCSHGSMAKAGSKGKSPVDPPVEFYCEAYEHGRKIGGFSFMAGDLPEALWKAARHGEVAIRPHITDLRVRTLTEAKEGAAPTSTPLDALIAKWRQRGKACHQWVTGNDKPKLPKLDRHELIGEGRVFAVCADELEKLLAVYEGNYILDSLDGVCHNSFHDEHDLRLRKSEG
jgi:hypothetical protein